MKCLSFFITAEQISDDIGAAALLDELPIALAATVIF